MQWDFQYPFNYKFTQESPSEICFFKSVKIRQNYGHESLVPLFWPTLSMHTYIHINKTELRLLKIDYDKQQQEAQLSPSDRAMRLVSSNLANCHAIMQKLLIRQVLTKLMV